MIFSYFVKRYDMLKYYYIKIHNYLSNVKYSKSHLIIFFSSKLQLFWQIKILIVDSSSCDYILSMSFTLVSKNDE